MIEFTDDLMIGVEKIDNQHKELIKRMDNFFVALKFGKGKEDIINLMNFMEYYVNNHFSEEEKLHEEINYPYLEKHKEIHKKFKEEIAKLKEELNSETALSTAIILSKKLIDWFINHIKKEDKKIGNFIKK